MSLLLLAVTFVAGLAIGFVVGVLAANELANADEWVNTSGPPYL